MKRPVDIEAWGRSLDGQAADDASTMTVPSPRLPRTNRCRVSYLPAAVRDEKLHLVCGWLYHEVFADTPDKALHHVTVRLYADQQSGHIGEAVTQLNGYFEVSFKRPAQWPANLSLRMFIPCVRYDRDGNLIRGLVEPLVNAHRGLRAVEVHSDVSDCGIICVPVWERRPVKYQCTPRLLIDASHKSEQEDTPGRYHSYLLVRMWAALLYNPITTAYGPPLNNLTMEMRRNPKKYDLPESDAYIVEMALNGFFPCLFKKVDNTSWSPPMLWKPGQYCVGFSYAGLGLDGKHFAPDTTAYFDIEGGQLRLVAVELRRRQGELQSSPDTSYAPPEMYYPSSKRTREGCMWERVKRVWRCNYFFFGEAYEHLGQCHLNVEQYVLAFKRNVRLNPIHVLLSSHFHGTTAINNRADQVLMGPTGLVTANSPLTQNSFGDLMHKFFRSFNWHSWRPRKVLVDSHRFAKLQVLYWDIIEEYVAEFISENASGITEYWEELRLMSDELVYHSVEWDSAHAEQPWSDTNELSTADSPRARNNLGRVAAVSPLTQDTTIQLLEGTNLSNLKQFCTYLIFFVTLRHSHINDKQYDLGGDPDFASLGLSTDITDASVDESSALSSASRDTHMRMTYALSNVNYGYILADEESEMNPALKKAVTRHAQELTALGLPPNEIRSSINV